MKRLPRSFFPVALLVVTQAALAACAAKESGGSAGTGGSDAAGAGGDAGAGGGLAGTGGAGTAGASGAATAGASGAGAGGVGGAGAAGASGAGAGGAGSGGSAGGISSNGAKCKAATECASGNCVDGVCCGTACDGACERCDSPASPGVCGPSPKGEVCRAAASGCDAEETCDGAATTCPADAVVPKDGPGVGACLGYACDGTTATCKGACTTTSDCASGFTCISKACTKFKHVFTSSKTYDGALGGLTGADQRCNDLAKAAGLPGTYMAWLTDSKQSPLTRFTPYAGPYALVTGSKLANDFSDLTDGLAGAAVLRDESGASVGMVLGWTGMTSSKFDPTETCGDWTSAAPSAQGTAVYTTWSQNVTQPCNSQARLYCVEQ